MQSSVKCSVCTCISCRRVQQGKQQGQNATYTPAQLQERGAMPQPVGLFLPVDLPLLLFYTHCCNIQDANKEGETPLSLAGDLAAALQEARSSGKVYSNGCGAMEH